jgi:glycosyltransferase involved in cell wall biosynthesis
MEKVISKKSLCCILNHAPHYRESIFRMLDDEFNCSFYIGDKVISPVKQMNYKNLKGFKKVFSNKWILGTTFMWNNGVVNLILKKYDFYLLIGEPSILSNWVILIIAKVLNKKVFIWGHGIKDLSKNKNYWFERLFHRLPHKIFVYGDRAKNNMISLNYKEDKIIPIYNSLNYSEQVEIRKNLTSSNIFTSHFKNNYPVVIYVGRILYSKKLNLIVEATNKLIKEGEKINLVIVGPEVDDQSIPKLVEKLNLQQSVWFYGPCYQEKLLAELFYNSNVSVTPGDIGLSAIHSLTYGCPVITHDNLVKHGPEFEVIENNITGSFFKEDNLIDLVEKIKFWINIDNSKKIATKKYAFRLIEEKWNPYNQLNIFIKSFNS